jgi:hypothetical protein
LVRLIDRLHHAFRLAYRDRVPRRHAIRVPALEQPAVSSLHRGARGAVSQLKDLIGFFDFHEVPYGNQLLAACAGRRNEFLTGNPSRPDHRRGNGIGPLNSRNRFLPRTANRSARLFR